MRRVRRGRPLALQGDRASSNGAADDLDDQLAWLRQMVDWQDETEDSREFLKSLKIDLSTTRRCSCSRRRARS